MLKRSNPPLKNVAPERQYWQRPRVSRFNANETAAGGGPGSDFGPATFS